MGDCHYLEGNVYAAKRMQLIEKLMDLSGIGRDRVGVYWVSAAEGQLFADTVSKLTREAGELGPFEKERYGLELAAIERVLKGPRVRWLSGMDRQVTERGNVYGERVDEEAYQLVFEQATGEEYQKALILESLAGGPQSVRDIAGRTQLPVYTVSIMLGDLERRGLAELKGYEGSTPKFISLAA